MSKIRTTLTIDEEVYEKAKKQIPNLSEFLEECLKHYSKTEIIECPYCKTRTLNIKKTICITFVNGEADTAIVKDANEADGPEITLTISEVDGSVTISGLPVIPLTTLLPSGQDMITILLLITRMIITK